MSDVWVDPDLEALLQAVLALATGMPGPGLVLQVIGAMFRLIQGPEGDSRLARIDENTQKVVAEAFESGQKNLKRAASPDIDAQRQVEYLKIALDKFISAGHLMSPPDDIRAMIYAAVCDYCLGDTHSARQTLQEAYDKALAHRRGLLERETKIERPTGLDALGMWLAVLASMFTGGLAFAAVYERKKTLQQAYLLQLFGVETQVKALQRALPSLGLPAAPIDFYFPADVVHVQTSASTLPQTVQCFNRQGALVMVVTLGYGNRFNKRLVHPS